MVGNGCVPATTPFSLADSGRDRRSGIGLEVVFMRACLPHDTRPLNQSRRGWAR